MINNFDVFSCSLNHGTLQLMAATGKRGRILHSPTIYACKNITYACQRSRSPCQSAVEWGNAKLSQQALKVSQSLKRWTLHGRTVLFVLTADRSGVAHCFPACVCTHCGTLLKKMKGVGMHANVKKKQKTTFCIGIQVSTLQSNFKGDFHHNRTITSNRQPQQGMMSRNTMTTLF